MRAEIFGKIIDEMNDPVLIIEAGTGLVAYMNGKAVEVLGYSSPAEMNDPDAMLWIEGQSSKDNYFSIIRDVMDGRPRSFEWRIRTRNSGLLWMEAYFKRIGTDEGEFIFAVLKDITGHKKVQTDLEMSEVRYRDLINTATDGIFIADATGRFISINDNIRTVVGYEPAELIGRSCIDIVAPEYIPVVLQNMREKLMGSKTSTTYEAEMITKDGRRMFFEMSTSVRFMDGRPAEIFGIARNIDDRKKMEQELIKARDEAEAANRIKSEFVANTSHEIKTPINSIMGFSDLLMSMKLDAEQAKLVKYIRSSAGHLYMIINDILDFSKVEAGKLDIESVEFNLEQLASEIMATKKIVSARASVSGIVNIDKDLKHNVFGDPYRLKQVLINLVDNAFKFTQEGSVTLSISVENEETEHVLVRIEVSDTGIGMDQGVREKIFMPFTQADASTTRNFGGTGLGLSIAQKIVKLMGGDGISVESESGAGSRFSFSVRFAKGRPVEPGAEGRTLYDIATENGSAMSILLVEDTFLNIELVSMFLMQKGHRIFVVENGALAVSAVKKELESGRDFDAILMDIHMPVMNGYDASMKIRNLGSRAPIIGMTADSLKETAEACSRSGMNCFVSKPINLNKLEAMIKETIKRGDREVVFSGGGGIIVAPNKTVDFDALMKNAGGSVENARRLCGGFVREVWPAFYELERVSSYSDAEGMTALAHKIKGMALTIFASKAQSIAGSIEESVNKFDMVSASGLIGELRNELEALEAEIDIFVSSSGRGR